MSTDSEVAREQAHVDRAYERLEVLRRRAEDRSAEVVAQGRGGTHQARHDRDALVRSTLHRLEQIDAAEYGLVFGRIDETDGDTWHIGRLGISDDRYETLVVDWRAPDILRLAPVPLYNRFVDVHAGASKREAVVDHCHLHVEVGRAGGCCEGGCTSTDDEQ